MANDFSRYIQQQMDARGWNNAELARRAGLNDAHVSKLRTNGAKTIPDAATIAGLAKAFGASEQEVLLHAARAIGVRVDTPPPAPTVRSLLNEDLLAELGRRLAEQRPDFRPEPVDLNTLEDRAIPQVDDLMTGLRADAATSRAAGNTGLAAVQAHLADYLEALLANAEATNGHSANLHAQSSDPSARP